MRFLFALVLFCSLPAWSLTLNEAENQALANAHDIKEMEIAAEAAGWEQLKAGAAFLPKLDLTGRHLFNERFQELEIEFGGGSFVIPAIQPYTDLGLQAKLNVFDGFASTHEWKAARLNRQAANLHLQSAKLKKSAQIRTLFYRALGAQIQQTVAEQNAKTLEEHLDDVHARLRSGVSTKFDSLRVEVQLEEAKTDVIAATDRITLARAELFKALGIPDDGGKLEGTIPDDWSKVDLQKADLKQVHRDDREARVLETEEQHQRALAARGHWLPKVSLFGAQEWYNNYNHAILQSDERFKSAYSYGVLLSWNLFDGGASLASQRMSALAEQKEHERLAQMDQNIPADLDEAKRKLAYNISTYKARMSAVHKAEESVRLARSGLRNGVRTNTEVLDAVVDLNRAKALAVKTQVEAVEALGSLEIALGHTL